VVGTASREDRSLGGHGYRVGFDSSSYSINLNLSTVQNPLQVLSLSISRKHNWSCDPQGVDT